MYGESQRSPNGIPRGYMAQIQGQLGVCRLPWCDFMAVCTRTREITLKRVHFSPLYWKHATEKLKTFCSVLQVHFYSSLRLTHTELPCLLSAMYVSAGDTAIGETQYELILSVIFNVMTTVITARRKVMFSEASVSHSVHRGGGVGGLASQHASQVTGGLPPGVLHPGGLPPVGRGAVGLTPPRTTEYGQQVGGRMHSCFTPLTTP